MSKLENRHTESLTWRTLDRRAGKQELRVKRHHFKNCVAAVMAAPLRGDVAVLADNYPLSPHVTVRVAGFRDPLCSCGLAADFVLLEIDVASEPPHADDLNCRICYRWQRMLVGACARCFPGAIEMLGHESSTL